MKAVPTGRSGEPDHDPSPASRDITAACCDQPSRGPVTPNRRIPETSQSFAKALAALAYAEQLDEGQRREADGAPFGLHLLEVCCLLYHAGAPDHVIAAGVLHDTIEKTDVTSADLRARFGTPVTTLVLAVSEDQSIVGYAQRKAALRQQVARAGHEAMTIFAADKISRVRELRIEQRQTRRRPARGSRSRTRRATHYQQCLQLLEELMIDSVLVTELRRELDKPPPIAALPAATSPQHLDRAV